MVFCLFLVSPNPRKPGGTVGEGQRRRGKDIEGVIHISISLYAYTTQPRTWAYNVEHRLSLHTAPEYLSLERFFGVGGGRLENYWTFLAHILLDNQMYIFRTVHLLICKERTKTKVIVKKTQFSHPTPLRKIWF